MPGGSSIGSLLVEERISSERSGELLVARQPGLGRRVLVRRLHRDCLDDPHLVERFRREGRMAARVVHPNVQQAFDLFAWRGDHYLVLESVEGESLRGLLDRAPSLPRPVALALALELARGVEAVHRAGLVHADLRPENVRVGRAGDVKLTGLGWARGRAETGVGVPDATRYTAPEVSKGEDPGIESDAFSLAAMATELLAGRAPPEARLRGPRSLAKRLAAALDPDPGRRPDVTLLREALEREAGEGSPAAARARIAGWLVQASEPAAEVVVGGGSGKGRTRRILWLATLGGVGAGLAAALFVARDRVIPPASRAQEQPGPLHESLPGGHEAPTVDAGPRAALAPPVEPARLRLAIFPWAEIRIDGGPAIVTPHANALMLAPGAHQIEIVHPTLGRVVREVRLEPGEEKTLRHVFDRVARP